MKRFRRVMLLLVILAGIAAALRFTVFRTKPVPVAVARVDYGRVERIVVNSKAGTIRARLRAQLSPGVSGKVVELLVRKGARVEKGQLLLRLDDDEYLAQIAGSERALDAARAAEHQSALEADLAGKELERNKRLAAEGAIAALSYETLESRRDVARANVASARERARQAATSIDAARAALEKTRVVAPFSGIVAAVSTELGEWLSPSPPGVLIPPVIDLVDLDSVYVSAPLDEVDLARVRTGLPVRITIDAFRDSAIDGVVTRVAPTVVDREEQNRTFEVEADFRDREKARAFSPGATADVEIILDARDHVLRVPTYAILEGGKVLVVKDGVLVAVPVEKGLSNWQFTEIARGLSPGDAVVVSLDRAEVKEGAAVVVENASAGEETADRSTERATSAR